MAEDNIAQVETAEKQILTPVNDLCDLQHRIECCAEVMQVLNDFCDFYANIPGVGPVLNLLIREMTEMASQLEGLSLGKKWTEAINDIKHKHKLLEKQDWAPRVFPYGGLSHD